MHRSNKCPINLFESHCLANFLSNDDHSNAIFTIFVDFRHFSWMKFLERKIRICIKYLEGGRGWEKLSDSKFSFAMFAACFFLVFRSLDGEYKLTRTTNKIELMFSLYLLNKQLYNCIQKSLFTSLCAAWYFVNIYKHFEHKLLLGIFNIPAWWHHLNASCVSLLSNNYKFWMKAIVVRLVSRWKLNLTTTSRNVNNKVSLMKLPKNSR